MMWWYDTFPSLHFNYKLGSNLKLPLEHKIDKQLVCLTEQMRSNLNIKKWDFQPTRCLLMLGWLPIYLIFAMKLEALCTKMFCRYALKNEQTL